MDRTSYYITGSDIRDAIRGHMQLLGHQGFGVTEFRVFKPMPQVAYADNEDDAVRLCLEMVGKTSGVYVGVQPRPLELFDRAPNCWRPARSGAGHNYACDSDIEHITDVYFDIDVRSAERAKGHPASGEELLYSLHAAELLCREAGMALSSMIYCSGNGHGVLAPIVPIPVDNDEISAKFKCFCQKLAEKTVHNTSVVRFDNVFNLSRVMRVIGTRNHKGQAIEGRPHRRAHIVSKSVLAMSKARSMALHHMIVNTEFEQNTLPNCEKALPQAIKCNLSKIERCCFVQYCRAHPEQISEPQWWAMITNLAHLEGGPALIHEISRLDQVRYDYANTEQLIKRVIASGYRPVSCQVLMNFSAASWGQGRFTCPRIKECPARAPMYMTSLYSVYTDQGDLTMENETRKRPIKVFRCGSVKAAVWSFPKNKDGEMVQIPSVTITKSYKDKETEEWKTTDFLNPDDLPKVVTVATEAYRHLRLESTDPGSQSEASDLLQGAEQ